MMKEDFIIYIVMRYLDLQKPERQYSVNLLLIIVTFKM